MQVMVKFVAAAMVFASVLPAARPAHAEVLGSDAAACRAGAPGPAALVHVEGFTDRKGRLRLQYYTDKPDEYLVTGKYLRRVELPVTPDGTMTLCITLPGPGRFAFVALHDRDENGKLSIWSDGIGFSNNPRLGLAKPAARLTAVDAGTGVTELTIVLNYLRGLSVRPIGG